MFWGHMFSEKAFQVGGVMVLGSAVQCRGILQIWIREGQGPTALAVGAGGGCLDIFLSSIKFLKIFFLHLSGRRPDID